MIVGGIDRDTLEAAALGMDCELSNLRPVGRRWGFQIKTHRADFQRRGVPYQKSGKWRAGRRISSPCYHVYRDLVRLFFAAGADYMQTTAPGGSWQSGNSGKVTYRSRSDFDTDLPLFGEAYVGSKRDEWDGVPAAMSQLCEHGDCYGTTSTGFVIEQNRSED